MHDLDGGSHENKKKNAGMQLQFLGADFKGVSYSYLARVGRNSFKLDLPIIVGTKIRMTFDRRVVGVWYSFVLTPFITKSQVIDLSEEPEVVDEGVQLPLARGVTQGS